MWKVATFLALLAAVWRARRPWPRPRSWSTAPWPPRPGHAHPGPCGALRNAACPGCFPPRSRSCSHSSRSCSPRPWSCSPSPRGCAPAPAGTAPAAVGSWRLWRRPWQPANLEYSSRQFLTAVHCLAAGHHLRRHKQLPESGCVAIFMIMMQY